MRDTPTHPLSGCRPPFRADHVGSLLVVETAQEVWGSL